MNEEKNLNSWITEIAEPLDGFQAEFEEDPAATLRARGFALHPSYEEMLNKLSPEDRAGWAGFIVQVAKANPSDLRDLYSAWVDRYELFFGWEELEEESTRGWA
jgi:hypothetical protein